MVGPRLHQLRWWAVGLVITAVCASLAVALQPEKADAWWWGLWTLIAGGSLLGIVYVWSLYRQTPEWRLHLSANDDRQPALIELKARNHTRKLGVPRCRVKSPGHRWSGWYWESDDGSPQVRNYGVQGGVSQRWPFDGQALQIGPHKIEWRGTVKTGGRSRTLCQETWFRARDGSWTAKKVVPVNDP